MLMTQDASQCTIILRDMLFSFRKFACLKTLRGSFAFTLHIHIGEPVLGGRSYDWKK